MQKMYSPEKKVMLLLRVCKLIYTVMENNSVMPSADLPVSPPTLQFTRWSEFTGTSGSVSQLEHKDVWCSLLTREFSEDVLFSFGFFSDICSLIQQNYLRVAFQEVNSGCTGKTLLVRPYITTEDVCQLCAEKFKVDNPKEYSLFLFVDDTWQQLTEDTYPQKIKAELHSRPQPQVFHFVYKRINSDPYIVQNIPPERLSKQPVKLNFLYHRLA
uniref:Ras-associating domain-containing protein n=1 Tax=Pavo cristatus TaxID=9049 RepID=A0A8C9FMY7_PAVCR